MAERRFVLVVLARESRIPSIVWGPLTRAEAERLNEALYQHGHRTAIAPGGIFSLTTPFGVDGRAWIGGVCILDDSS